MQKGPLDLVDKYSYEVNRGSLLALLRECAGDETLPAPELAPQTAVTDANSCILVTKVACYERKRAA